MELQNVIDIFSDLQTKINALGTCSLSIAKTLERMYKQHNKLTNTVGMIIAIGGYGLYSQRKKIKALEKRIAKIEESKEK